jgi:CRP-like cAMP-binding protein
MTRVIAAHPILSHDKPWRCIQLMPLSAEIAHDLGSIPERPSNLCVIEACSLLNALEPAAREELAGRAFMAYAEKGEIIWMAGAPADFCSVVGVGFVKMTKSTPHGQEVAVELLGPGQAFGLMAAIEGRSFPLAATAVTNTWYLKIPTRELMCFYRDSTPLKDQIIRNIAPRLRKAHDMMGRLSSGRVDERIAAVLFILADSYGRRTASGIELAVPLTRQDISEMAGTTTESTIRVLSRWQKDGLVSTTKRLITILAPDDLLEVLQG